MAAPDLSVRTAQAIERLARTASLGPPPLIEGEDGAAYNQLHGSITAAVKPKDFIEEILARDIADLSWDVLRLRRARVDELLCATGLTVESVTAEVFVAISEALERIDRMMMSAESRRNTALREIERHRSSFAQALRRASEEVVEAEFEDVAPDRRAQKDAA